MDLLDYLAELDAQSHDASRLTDLEAHALAHMIRGLAKHNDPALETYTARGRTHGLDVDQIIRTAYGDLDGLRAEVARQQGHQAPTTN